MELLVFVIFWMAVLGGVGYWIARLKRRSEAEGFVLGCLLGPIGWLIEAVLPTGEGAAPAPIPSAAVPEPPAETAQRPDAHTRVPTALIEDFDTSTDARRDPSGTDGASPGQREFKGTSAADAIEQMVEVERDVHTRFGHRVVEAAWRGDTDPVIFAAFGDSSKTYDLLWPGEPRVRWTSPLDDLEAPAITSVTETAPTPVSEPRADEAAPSAAEREPVTPAELAGTARPMKQCPDCAEMILADARICRFCRYEFWPRPER